MGKQLAVDDDGNLSWCSVPAFMRGVKGCPHVSHIEKGEAPGDFTARIEKEQSEKRAKEFTSNLKSDFDKFKIPVDGKSKLAVQRSGKLEYCAGALNGNHCEHVGHVDKGDTAETVETRVKTEHKARMAEIDLSRGNDAFL